MKTKNKRTTIYLDENLQKALWIKVAVTENSISELVNEAIKYSLTEEIICLQ